LLAGLCLDLLVELTASPRNPTWIQESHFVVGGEGEGKGSWGGKREGGKGEKIAIPTLICFQRHW